MHITCSRLAVLLPVLCAFTPAQDILFYRFDDAYGTNAINYVPTSTAPNQGAITNLMPGPSWVPGKFGAALAAGVHAPVQPNRVDTGWIPTAFSGSFSYALWLKAGSGAPPTNIYYIFGLPVGF